MLFVLQITDNFKHYLLKNFSLLVSSILKRQWQKRIGLLTLVTTCRTYLPWGIKKVPSPLTILSSLDDIITRLQAHCSFSHHTKSFQIEVCHIIYNKTYRILDWKYITSHLSKNNPKLRLQRLIGVFQLSSGITYFSVQDYVSHGIAPMSVL